jgi:hypothetical protein
MLLWQRSFLLAPALLPTTPLLVAAVEEAEAEAECAPVASTAVACALPISGAAPFTPGVFTADAGIALQEVFDPRIR